MHPRSHSSTKKSLLMKTLQGICILGIDPCVHVANSGSMRYGADLSRHKTSWWARWYFTAAWFPVAALVLQETFDSCSSSTWVNITGGSNSTFRVPMSALDKWLKNSSYNGRCSQVRSKRAKREYNRQSLVNDYTFKWMMSWSLGVGRNHLKRCGSPLVFPAKSMFL